jgi:hypothetical protein
MPLVTVMPLIRINIACKVRLALFSDVAGSLIMSGVHAELAHYGELNSVLYGEGPKNCSSFPLLSPLLFRTEIDTGRRTAYEFPGVYDAASFNKMAQIITSVGEAAYAGAVTKFVNKVRPVFPSCL